MRPVCFITPPSPFLLDERVFVALGILKVAAVVEKTRPVEHLDLNGVTNYEEAVSAHCAYTGATIFCITATTPQMPAALKILTAIRRVTIDNHVVLGGPHPTLVNAAAKGGSLRAKKALDEMLEKFDSVVAGDGEKAIHKALERPWNRTPGVIDADDPKSDLFMSSEDFGESPWPARHLVDIDSYHYEIDGVKVMSIISQLGCPFGCRFCGGRNSPMLRRMRLRDTPSVIAEMRMMHEEYDCRGFMFFDDELNVNPKVEELMNEIYELQNELGVEFRCRGFIKAELFNSSQANAMYRAGFRRLLCGFESGSPRILKNINKVATLEDNTRVMEIAKEQGLEIKALMSIGHPGESTSTVMDTYLWLLKVKPADFDITIITPYPGCPYYEEAEEVSEIIGMTPQTVWKYTVNGDTLYMLPVDYSKVEDYYKGDPEGGYKSHVYTEEISAGSLVVLRGSVDQEVRRTLGIPVYTAKDAVALQYEHSMGMTPQMLRRVE